MKVFRKVKLNNRTKEMRKLKMQDLKQKFVFSIDKEM